MPPRKPFIFRKYVEYNKELDKSKCLHCEKLLCGKRLSNIKRHYRLVHNIVVEEEDCENERAPVGKLVRAVKQEKPNVKTIVKSNSGIFMDKSTFIKCCVGLTTVQNIPFGIFDDNKFFKALIAPYEKLFGINLNSGNIVTIIRKTSDRIKQIILKRIRNKMISLKVDVATQMNRSVLGINIQYIRDCRIFTNTIGVIQLKKKYTASVLKDKIIKCLEEFNINMSQIYYITVDNGSNVLLASKVLQDLQEHLNEEIHQSTNNSDQDEKIYSALVDVFPFARCAAHSIQLAAHGVLEIMQPNLKECRNAVKKVRTIIKGVDSNLTIPTYDNTCNWISTFEMLNELLKLMETIENFFGAEDLNIDWKFISNFVSAFQPLVECTKKLQSEQYIIGDFYRDWLSCELELEDLRSSSPFAGMLCNAMKKRKQELMENDIFLAALYLDPRFNFENSVMLTDEQKRIAVEHLVKTYDSIQELEYAENSSQYNSDHASLQDFTIENTATTLPGSSRDSYAKLALRMQQMIAQAPARSTTEKSFRQKLTMLADGKMASLDTNVLQYWTNFYNNDNDLKRLVQVALAVPSTQVSIERTLSALSVIISKLKSKISNKKINNIVITKLNYSLIENVKLDFLDELIL